MVCITDVLAVPFVRVPPSRATLIASYANYRAARRGWENGFDTNYFLRRTVYNMCNHSLPNARRQQLGSVCILFERTNIERCIQASNEIIC